MKVKLSNILVKRIVPFIWDISIYTFGLSFIFTHMKFFLFLFYFLFATHKLSNIFFDFFTIAIEISSNSFPTNEIKIYDIHIYDKKYYFKKSNLGKYKANEEEYNTVLIDKNNTYTNVYIYTGTNTNIENALYFIYVYGLTTKNYTREHTNNFTENELFYS